MTNFVSQLRAYLLGLDESPPSELRGVSGAAHRAFFYRQLASLATTDRRARELLREWKERKIDGFIASLIAELRATIAHEASPSEVDALVESGIRIAVGMPVAGLPPFTELLLRRLASDLSFDATFPEASDPGVATYAFEVRLVRRGAAATAVSPIGHAWLSVPGVDALSLLMALEHAQSLGSLDPFRLAEISARQLLQSPNLSVFEDEWPAHDKALQRLASCELLRMNKDEDGEIFSVDPTPLGRAVLEETSSPSSPWRLVAQALVDEERGALTSSLVPAFRRAEADSLRDARTREAEALAHEVRNALVPVPTQLDRLYQALDRAHPEFDLEPYRALIDPGVARVFEYVDARLQAAAILEAQREIDLVSTLERLPKVAHRLVDIRSNAPLFVSGTSAQIQSTLHELESNARGVAATTHLWVTLEKKNGYAHLIVEDNGPGIADIDMPRVFERGFSRRGSSGHGLAIVRDRVVNEMGGRIEVGPSTHGGPRFLMIFPLSTRTS